MAKDREINQKIKCIGCGEEVRAGYRRISGRCRKCQQKFRNKKFKKIIERGKI